MERAKRISDRLPEFYRAWDTESVLYKLIFAVGTNLDEQRKDLFRIVRMHWVDSARGVDLDSMGAIFDLSREPGEKDEVYRERIKNILRRFKGGGTRESILSLVSEILAVKQDQLELIENPPTPMSVTRRVNGGESWTMGSMSIEDASPVIGITLDIENGSILNPRISNRDTGESVSYDGALRTGQTLLLSKGSATLDGEDVSSRAELKNFPRLVREGSSWTYDEAISERIGRYDRNTFDSSIFEVDVPPATVNFSWTGNPPASFELRVPARALLAKEISTKRLESFLNVIKGAGVKTSVVLMENDSA